MADLYSRLMAIAVAALLSVAVGVPALARSDEAPGGLDRARHAAAAAIELATNRAATPTTQPPSSAAPSSEPPGDVENGAGTTAPGRGNSGKGNSAKGNSGKGNVGNGNTGKGNSGVDSDKTTGPERAAQAIARALEAGNGDGNGFGRGQAAEIIASLLIGEVPDSLTVDESHGAEVRAMVAAYNELRGAESG